MSSTNRSKARQKHISDYYVTPVKDIIDFLTELKKGEDIFNNDSLILDPCAGGDKNHKMSYPEAITQIRIDRMNITTIDIREDSLALNKENYLDSLWTKNKYDIIITNPPFNQARQIIEKALEDVKENGYVIMLLRLNFFGSKARFGMWKNQLPKYAFVHHSRMSFREDKKTDSIEYMHCVWQKGYKPNFTQLKVI